MRKAVFLVALVLVACRHGDSYYQKGIQSPCDVGPPSQGFVCIDASLTPRPNPVHQVRDKWVHAFLTNGDELEIASDVFDNVGHAGNHAWAHVRKDAVVGQEYKYTIYDRTSGSKQDPEVMIDPSP